MRHEYVMHRVRAHLQGFRPLTLTQFIHQAEYCELSAR